MRLANQGVRKLKSQHLYYSSARLQNAKEFAVPNQNEAKHQFFTTSENIYVDKSRSKVLPKQLQTQCDLKLMSLPSIYCTVNTRPTTCSGPSRRVSAKLHSLFTTTSSNKFIEVNSEIIHHNRNKTDPFQFRKAVFVNSLKELKTTLQRQSDKLNLNDRLRKGVIEGGYTNRIQLVAQTGNNLRHIVKKEGIK